MIGTDFQSMMALEPHGPDTFVATGPRYPWGGLYGGQIIAQALRAASLTVDPGYRLHSLHAYFIRLGDAAEPIRLEVDRIRNGRSFLTRRVVARQSVGAILNLSSSFHVPEEGSEVQTEQPPRVAAPDELDPSSFESGADGSQIVWRRNALALFEVDNGIAGDVRLRRQATLVPLNHCPGCSAL